MCCQHGFYTRQLVRGLLACLLSAATGQALCSMPEQGMYSLNDEDIQKDDFPEGSTIILNCAFGYEEKGGSGKIICNNGAWTLPTLSCRKRTCGSPKLIENGRFNLSEGIEFRAIARVVCNRGYESVDSSFQVCLKDGWTGKSPKCEKVKCASPSEIEHGQIVGKPDSGRIAYNESVVYSCDTGYTLIGEPTITCSENGLYQPQPPICEKNSSMCSSPKVDSKNHVVLLADSPSVFRNGSVATFQCQNGFVSNHGLAQIHCQNGTWTPLVLHCTGKMCDLPDDIPNGFFLLLNGLAFGAEAKVKCNKGYELHGQDIIKCLHEGWSKSSAVCKEIQCPDPPAIANGRVAMKPLTAQPRYGDIIVYSCYKGYILRGNPMIKCWENGVYVPSPPHCV